MDSHFGWSKIRSIWKRKNQKQRTLRARPRLPKPCNKLAEREGFEPPIPFQVCPLSRRIVSTTHAPLRANGLMIPKSDSPRFTTEARRNAKLKMQNLTRVILFLTSAFFL